MHFIMIQAIDLRQQPDTSRHFPVRILGNIYAFLDAKYSDALTTIVHLDGSSDWEHSYMHINTMGINLWVLTPKPTPHSRNWV